MTVPRLRAVTAPLLIAGLLAASAAMLAACGSDSRLAGASLPGDGPTRGRGGMQDASRTGGATPSGQAGPTGQPGPSGGITGRQWLQAAHDAFAAAPSVHITGTAVRGADAYVVDVRLAGERGGTATIKTSGQTVQVVRIGDDAYVGGDLAFWQSVTGDPAQARRMVGSFVKTTAADGNFGAFTAFTRPATFAAVLPDPAQPAVVGTTTTIGGRTAVAVRDRTGSTLYVATTGPAYPLRLDGLTDGQVVFLDLTDYGQPVPLTAPPTAKLAGSGVGS